MTWQNHNFTKKINDDIKLISVSYNTELMEYPQDFSCAQLPFITWTEIKTFLEAMFQFIRQQSWCIFGL